MIDPFYLERDEDAMIVIPPADRINGDDENIEQFVLACIEDTDQWLLAILIFNEDFSYPQIYDYVKKSYGDGMSKYGSRLFINRFSDELSEEETLVKIEQGEYKAYLTEYTIASIASELINSGYTSSANMWNKGDDVTVVTMTDTSVNVSMAVYINTVAIEEYIATELEAELLASL